MMTDRPYRKRLPLEEAKAQLKKSAGSQNDPAVVDALLRVLAEKEHKKVSDTFPSGKSV
jgi:HD-GYP domain-containing protein (c-di-GMP phosphodiesterase class II)